MVKVMVTNKSSDYWNQEGRVREEDWRSDSFWVKVWIANHELWIARRSLALA